MRWDASSRKRSSWGHLTQLPYLSPRSDITCGTCHDAIPRRASQSCVAGGGRHPNLLCHPSTWSKLSGFVSLKELEGCSNSLSDLQHILRHLAPHNILHSLEWCHSLGAPLQCPQEVLDAIAQYCNPHTLHRLYFYSLDPAADEQQLDVDAGELIGISPLFKFTNLQDLNLNITECII